MKKEKIAAWTGIILPLILATLVLAIIPQPDSGAARSRDEVVEIIEDGWYYMKDGEKTSVTLPAVIEQKEGSSLTLYHDGLTSGHAGGVITTRAAVYKLKVFADGELLYQYKDEQFPRNVQMASKFDCNAPLTYTSKGKTISLEYQNTEDGIYHIPEVAAGSRIAVFRYLCWKDAFLFATIFVMVVLGVLTIGIALYLRHVEVRERRFMDSACFLLICGTWFTTDSSVAQMVSGTSPVILYISFYAFMLLAVPMLYFVKHTGKMEKYWQIDVCIGLFYVNAIIQSLLHYFSKVEFIDMLFVTHLLLAGGVALLVILMLREYRREHDRGILMILQAFTALAAGGIIALALYWLLEIPYYGVFFNCGIMAFVILLIRSLIITMVENLRFKTEMKVYRRLEKEDRLTGLKNRKAFDEYIIELEQKAGTYKDIVLIFMDLNHLKDINDRFGYGVGNEAIITAARCIESAYAPDGDCFRVGGDEFVVILPDETAEDAELSRRLNAQITMCSKNCRYRLSIARGISRIRDENGYLKTISDWKREADMNMYANKGWVRR